MSSDDCPTCACCVGRAKDEDDAPSLGECMGDVEGIDPQEPLLVKFAAPAVFSDTGGSGGSYASRCGFVRGEARGGVEQQKRGSLLLSFRPRDAGEEDARTLRPSTAGGWGCGGGSGGRSRSLLASSAFARQSADLGVPGTSAAAAGGGGGALQLPEPWPPSAMDFIAAHRDRSWNLNDVECDEAESIVAPHHTRSWFRDDEESHYTQAGTWPRWVSEASTPCRSRRPSPAAVEHDGCSRVDADSGCGGGASASRASYKVSLGSPVRERQNAAKSAAIALLTPISVVSVCASAGLKGSQKSTDLPLGLSDSRHVAILTPMSVDTVPADAKQSPEPDRGKGLFSEWASFEMLTPESVFTEAFVGLQNSDSDREDAEPWGEVCDEGVSGGVSVGHAVRQPRPGIVARLFA